MAIGVVAPLSANTDKAAELGEEAAACLTGENCADVKLKWSDKVVFVGASFGSETLCGRKVETDSNLLFMHVTYVMKGPTEMAENLIYTFSTHPCHLW